MILRTAAIASRAGLVAAAIALAAFSTGSAQAAPIAPAVGLSEPSEVGIVPVQYGWGRHGGYGHHRGYGHRRGWGHRHHGWGHRHHGWGHRHGGHRGFYRY